MKIKEKDVFQLKNLIKAMEKCEYPRLNGLQIIAFTRMFEWLRDFSSEAFREYEEDKAIASLKDIESKNPIKDLDPKPSKPPKISKSKTKKKIKIA